MSFFVVVKRIHREKIVTKSTILCERKMFLKRSEILREGSVLFQNVPTAKIIFYAISYSCLSISVNYTNTLKRRKKKEK